MKKGKKINVLQVHKLHFDIKFYFKTCNTLKPKFILNCLTHARQIPFQQQIYCINHFVTDQISLNSEVLNCDTTNIWSYF